MKKRTSGRFFDTNVVLCAFQPDDDPRSRIARDLLNSGGTISVQTLNEFASVARRKLNMTWDEVTDSLSAVRALCGSPLPITAATHEAGIEIARRYGYRIYDSLIIATALEASCGILYSEDMQNGQQIQGLAILNPF